MGLIKINRSQGIGIVIVLFTFIWLALIGIEWAEAAEPSQENDEYSFNWLDPEKKIYVLQNRKYLKAMHPIVSVIGDVGLSNPYMSTYMGEGRFSFYFSEAWGLELFYGLTSSSPNNTMQALQNSSPNALPNIREINSQFGAMVHWVPWYAKINVFNSILYFDWYFGLGAGNLQSQVDTRTSVSAAASYVQQSLPGLFFSTGHYYHLSHSFLVRLDVTGSVFQAPVYGATGSPVLYSNFNFGVGLGWKI